MAFEGDPKQWRARNGNLIYGSLPPDGRALDGYVFLDVIRLEHAWDYRRSVMVVEMNEGRKHMRFGNGRMLREDIPGDVQIFRDAHSRYEVLVSRELAGKIAQLAGREMSFRDATTHATIDLPVSGGRRKLLARLKPATPPRDDESLPLDRRLAIRVLPLVGEGRFAEAEAALTELLQSRPITPYRIVTDLRVTISPEECAIYLDDFYLRASKEHPVKTVYLEMNGFTINPDLWFCDAFGFRKAGDDEGTSWLGEFDSSSEEQLVIAGLEPLQAVFDAEGTVPDEQRDARQLASALVIVKFQALLRAALPLTKRLKCPLWATAHDHYGFLARIVPDT